MATIFAMVKLSESRDDETGNHIWRAREYCRELTITMSKMSEFTHIIDEQYIGNIYNATPLHDIGKVGIADSILLKPSRLTPEEFEIMKAHTTIGARTLEDVRKIYCNNAFIRTGIEISQSHHERWDGTGYPQGLAGEDIPLSARIMSLADIYDALRSTRHYKPSFDHEKSIRIILEGDGRTVPSHFDPLVLSAFRETTDKFEAIYAKFEAALDV
jgi:putative two-component system response regulator